MAAANSAVVPGYQLCVGLAVEYLEVCCWRMPAAGHMLLCQQVVGTAFIWLCWQ